LALPAERLGLGRESRPAWQRGQPNGAPLRGEAGVAREAPVLQADELAVARVPDLDRARRRVLDRAKHQPGDAARVRDPQIAIACVELCRIDDAGPGSDD